MEPFSKSNFYFDPLEIPLYIDIYIIYLILQSSHLVDVLPVVSDEVPGQEPAMDVVRHVHYH